ncbi:CapA family protein [Candidatus Wolfebacteria bacterium]|nr:CapA family protein [Candidatus Wolfebacteria bacterium]
MRYFVILTIVGIILVGAFLSVGQGFLAAYESANHAKLQANLLALKELEVNQNIEAVKNKPVTLLFVGDIMLSRGVASQIKKHNDFIFPFLKIADFTKSADLTFGNLEGPISARGQNQGSQYSFRARLESVEGLTFAGFDVLNLANNHIFDWGKPALEETMDILKANELGFIGAGRNYLEANAPLIKEVGNTKVAFLGFTTLYPKILEAGDDSTGISSLDLEKAKDIIFNLKRTHSADLIIASFHWGEEYKKQAGDKERGIAYALVNSGADLVVGHHPHVVQEIERYNDGLIAYSLGNFVFDQNFSQDTKTGLALRVIVQNKEIIKIEPVEIKINDFFQPEVDSLR